MIHLALFRHPLIEKKVVNFAGPKSRGFGPVVQRIVCRFPEPEIEVRFLTGLQEFL